MMTQYLIGFIFPIFIAHYYVLPNKLSSRYPRPASALLLFSTVVRFSSTTTKHKKKRNRKQKKNRGNKNEIYIFLPFIETIISFFPFHFTHISFLTMFLNANKCCSYVENLRIKSTKKKKYGKMMLSHSKMK